MLRALVVHPGPAYSVADVHRGWIDGLRANGVEVSDFNLGDRIAFFGNALLERQGETRYAFDEETSVRLAMGGVEGACYRNWPDVVVVVSAFFMPTDTLRVMRDRGHKIVILHTESPYEDERQLGLASYADLNILNDPQNLSWFEPIAPTVYIPHAYDPARHYRRRYEPGLASDLFFCGTGFPSRIEFLEACDLSGLNVKLAGYWQSLDDNSPLLERVVHPLSECFENEDTQRMYGSTKASLNLYRREAEKPELSEGWALSPREVELAATGTFFLREPRGEGDELLPMLPTFDGPEDFVEQLRWWLDHNMERNEAANMARRAVADRTFVNHAAQMLRLLKF